MYLYRSEIKLSMDRFHNQFTSFLYQICTIHWPSLLYSYVYDYEAHPPARQLTKTFALCTTLYPLIEDNNAEMDQILKSLIISLGGCNTLMGFKKLKSCIV